MYRLAVAISTISAVWVCSFCLGTSDIKGVPVDDSVAASLRGGACTGYTSYDCDGVGDCASQCYKSGGGNTDQNASNLADVCRQGKVVITCSRHFDSIAPCGSGTGGGTGN